MNPANEKYVFNTLYGDMETGEYIKPVAKFHVGDLVRISKWRHAFHKAYSENYTKEVYRIREVLRGNIVQYRLYDLNYEHILGKFYELELVGVNSE